MRPTTIEAGQRIGGQHLKVLLQMLPYLVTMIALAGAIGRSRPPSALGTPLAD